MISGVEQECIAGAYVDIGHRFCNGFELRFGKRTGVDTPAGSIAGYGAGKCGD